MYVAIATTTVYGQVREVGSTNERLELRENMIGDRSSLGHFLAFREQLGRIRPRSIALRGSRCNGSKKSRKCLLPSGQYFAGRRPSGGS